jgi:hypothetical protein
VRDSAHVVERSGKSEPKTAIEGLGRELRCQHHLLGAGPIGCVKEKPHHNTTCSLPPGLGHGGNPGNECLTASNGREGQATGRNGPAIVATRAGRAERGEGDDAARVVGISDAQLGNSLLFGKDPAPNLERGEPVFRTNCGQNLDSGRDVVGIRGPESPSLGTHRAPGCHVIII